MNSPMNHRIFAVLAVFSLILGGDKLWGQAPKDSLQVLKQRIAYQLDSLLGKEKLSLPKLEVQKGEHQVYVLKSFKGKSLRDSLSPIVLEALDYPSSQGVDDSTNFANFLDIRLMAWDSCYHNTGVVLTKEQGIYRATRARLNTLLYRAYRSLRQWQLQEVAKQVLRDTNVTILHTPTSQIDSTGRVEACGCSCSCKACQCHKPTEHIDSLSLKEEAYPKTAESEASKPEPKEVKVNVARPLSRTQFLTSLPESDLLQLFRTGQIDSLAQIEQELAQIWEGLSSKEKENKAFLDSLLRRYNLTSNLSVLWKDMQAIDHVLAGDSLALPSTTQAVLSAKNYTDYYYLKPFAPGLAEEYISIRIKRYKDMQKVQRSLIEHLVALEASTTAKAKQEELERYEAIYPLEQTAPYRKLDSLRRAYSRLEEGTDYLAGIFALCNFKLEHDVERALIDVLRLLDQKIKKPTPLLKSIDTSTYKKGDHLIAGHIFDKTFREHYLSGKYPILVKRVTDMLDKANFVQSKFPKGYPDFTSLFVKALLDTQK